MSPAFAPITGAALVIAGFCCIVKGLVWMGTGFICIALIFVAFDTWFMIRSERMDEEAFDQEYADLIHDANEREP